MLGNFMYCNPTKLYFGEDSLASLNEELPKYGQNVQLVYGGGKSTDWMAHMLGQAVAAHTDATHGMTLAAVSMAYYRFICPFGLAKFRRFAVNVWDVDPEGKSDEQIAAEGLKKMEVYMNELGLTMNLKELGVTEGMLPGIVESTLIMDGGYKAPDKDEIREILKNSL